MKKKLKHAWFFSYSRPTKLTRVIKLTLIFNLVFAVAFSANSFSRSVLTPVGAQDAYRSINSTIQNSGMNGVRLNTSEISHAVPDNEWTAVASKKAIQPSVSGKVTDEDCNPLPGVTVLEKGTSNGTITNAQGSYSISVAKGATLVFSFVGMKTREIVVGDQTTLDMTMENAAVGLEEVIAIGYGVQKKANLTGAVSEIKSDKLVDTPMPTIAQAMMGQASGVFVKNVNGQPGDNSGVSFNIRGFVHAPDYH